MLSNVTNHHFLLQTQRFHSVLAFLLLITLDIFKTLFGAFFSQLQDCMTSSCLMSSLSDVSWNLKKIIYIIWALETNCENFKVTEPSTLLFSGTGRVKDNWNSSIFLMCCAFFVFCVLYCPEGISTMITHCHLRPNQNLPILLYC